MLEEGRSKVAAHLKKPKPQAESKLRWTGLAMGKAGAWVDTGEDWTRGKTEHERTGMTGH